MHSPHLGYINIFPHLFNFHKKKNEIIDSFFGLLNDSSLLYSKFGIRSLSKSDIHFGKGDDYWRGAIWTPINFLILRSLKLYFNQSDQGILLYEKLKSDFEENVIREFEASGVLWENYCSNTGRGRREKGFTGWTSLIILILNEDYFQS